MTPSEFRAFGLAAYGGAEGWQTALAARLGVQVRTVRRWASGQSRIPPGVVAELTAQTGGGGWPRDEWIVGEGMPDADGHRREYIVHATAPRFIARSVEVDDGGPVPAEQPTDFNGVVYAAADDTDLCEIVWIDPPPLDQDELRSLLARAAQALDADDAP